jgi:hypothetical protein
MSFTPYYDSVVGIVSVNVNIQVSSLVALRTLSYGAPVGSNTNNNNNTTNGTTTGTTNNTGTNTTGTTTNSSSTNTPTQSSISQPETQKSQITDIVRLPAGEVVILGGLKEEDDSETRQSPFGLYDSVGSKITDKTTTLTFFILRPVVTIFDPKGANVNTTLPGDPSDFNERAFHDDTEANPVTVIEPTALPPKRHDEMNEDTEPSPTTEPPPPPPLKPTAHKLESKPPVNSSADATPPVTTAVHEVESKTSTNASADVVMPAAAPVQLLPQAAIAPSMFDSAPPLITEINNQLGSAVPPPATEIHGGP